MKLATKHEAQPRGAERRRHNGGESGIEDLAWDMAPMLYRKPSLHLSPLQDGHIHFEGLSQVCVESLKTHECIYTHTHKCKQGHFRS